MRHRLKRGLFVGFGVVVGVLLCVMLFLRRSSNELEAWKKRMRARGEKFAFVEVSKPFSQAVVDWELSLGNLAGRLATGPHAFSDLSLMATNETGYAQPAWRRENPSQKKSTNFWEEYISQMGSNEPVFAEVRNLIASKPTGSAMDPARLYSNSRAHNFMAWRAMAQNLAGATLCALHRGERVQALQDLHTLIDFPNAVDAAGGMIVHHAIYVVMMSLALSATWETCQEPALDDSQLAELSRRWQPLNFFGELTRVVEMERAFGLGGYEFARTNQGGMSPLFIGSRPARPITERFSDAMFEGLWRTAWAPNDELFFLQSWQPIMEGARAVSTNDCYRLFYARTRESRLMIDTAMAKGRLSQVRHVMALCLLPYTDKTFLHIWRQESFRRVTLTAIALKRYQLRHGRLPDSLAKLVPEFMPNELLDPMSGKSLRFQPAADGTMLLYSVGENGVDDGGLGDDVYWPRLGSHESDTTDH
jgi:hypothetical protein